MSAVQSRQYTLEWHRYLVLVLLWFANFIFGMNWFMQAPLVQPYWAAHQHVSFGTAEFLLSGVDIAGIFTSLLFGRFFDRFGPKRAVAICLTLILIGFGPRPFITGSFTVTLILAIVAGIALPIVGAPPPVLAQWFGRHRMAVPVLLALSAFPCGQAFGLLLGNRMVNALGIHWAFGVMSLATIVMLVSWLLFVPRAPSAPAGPVPERSAPLGPALRTVLRAPGSRQVFTIAIAYGMISVFASSFLPGVLTSTLSVSPTAGGEVVAVFPAASAIGIFAIARLTRWGGYMRFARLAAIAQLLMWIAFTVLWFTHSLDIGSTIVLLAIFGLCYELGFALGLERSEHGAGISADMTGVASGFFITGITIGGYVLPTILAQIVDAVGPRAGFIGLGVVILAGALLWATVLDPEKTTAHARKEEMV